MSNEDNGLHEDDENESVSSDDEQEPFDPWLEAEYTDTSDEEVSNYVSLSLFIAIQELRNTVGNIPMEWYDDYPHLGYDLDGKMILKPAQGDQVNIIKQ